MLESDYKDWVVTDREPLRTPYLGLLEASLARISRGGISHLADTHVIADFIDARSSARTGTEPGDSR